MNSMQKGKRGEREFAKFLRDHGFPARRGVQYAGGVDSPDVVAEEFPFHIEVKRCEKFRPGELRKAFCQASYDADGGPFIVAHRQNHRGWLIITFGEDTGAGTEWGYRDRRSIYDLTGMLCSLAVTNGDRTAFRVHDAHDFLISVRDE